MNFLAHLNLAYPDSLLMAGNFLCDFIKKPDESRIHPDLLEGIKMHRWIDSYSNNHLAIYQINSFFRPYIHKYAPVGTDITCDYLLFKNWESHNVEAFDPFQEQSYYLLKQQIKLLPENVQPICKKMIEHQWLNQYSHIEGLKTVFQRMNQKAKFPVDFTLILNVIQENEDQLSEHFNSFYADCRRLSTEYFNLQNERRR